MRDVEQARFKQIVSEYLLPMLPRSEFHGEVQKSPRSKKTVSWAGSRNALRLRPLPDSTYWYVIRRAQPFTEAERAIVQAFVGTMSELLHNWDKPFRRELASALESLVVARSVLPTRDRLVAEIIRTYTWWSTQTHEGQRMSAAIGIAPSIEARGVPCREILKSDFAKVLTDGESTLLVCSGEGNIVEHVALTVDSDKETLAPLQFVALAKWSQTGNVGISLKRNGEILVFGGGKLAFARRRGKWRYFPHEAIIKQIANRASGAWSSSLLVKQSM